MKRPCYLYASLLLTACGNPEGISDADYEKYQELGAPKILFSCTGDGRYTLEGLQGQEACLAISDLSKQMECLEEYKDPIPITNVGYVAGVGIGSTYNKILADAKEECSGEFNVLESEQ
jgi:hypothetical protein